MLSLLQDQKINKKKFLEKIYCSDFRPFYNFDTIEKVLKYCSLLFNFGFSRDKLNGYTLALDHLVKNFILPLVFMCAYLVENNSFNVIITKEMEPLNFQ